jgi:hypothetical protein
LILMHVRLAVETSAFCMAALLPWQTNLYFTICCEL